MYVLASAFSFRRETLTTVAHHHSRMSESAATPREEEERTYIHSSKKYRGRRRYIRPQEVQGIVNRFEGVSDEQQRKKPSRLVRALGTTVNSYMPQEINTGGKQCLL
jgi:hypothetical protein